MSVVDSIIIPAMVIFECDNHLSHNMHLVGINNCCSSLMPISSTCACGFSLLIGQGHPLI